MATNFTPVKILNNFTFQKRIKELLHLKNLKPLFTIKIIHSIKLIEIFKDTELLEVNEINNNKNKISIRLKYDELIPLNIPLINSIVFEYLELLDTKDNILYVIFRSHHDVIKYQLVYLTSILSKIFKRPENNNSLFKYNKSDIITKSTENDTIILHTGSLQKYLFHFLSNDQNNKNHRIKNLKSNTISTRPYNSRLYHAKTDKLLKIIIDSKKTQKNNNNNKNLVSTGNEYHKYQYVLSTTTELNNDVMFKIVTQERIVMSKKYELDNYKIFLDSLLPNIVDSVPFTELLIDKFIITTQNISKDTLLNYSKINEINRILTKLPKNTKIHKQVNEMLKNTFYYRYLVPPVLINFSDNKRFTLLKLQSLNHNNPYTIFLIAQ